MKLARLMRRLSSLCFIFIWIPFTILMIGVLTTPGVAGWHGFSNLGDLFSFLPAPFNCALMAILFLVFAMVFLLVGSLVVGGAANLSLRARGRPAHATVLQVWDTGTTVNDDPLVRLSLQVYPPDQPSFQAEAECIISRLQIPQIQPGAVVQVKYDPHSQAVALV